MTSQEQLGWMKRGRTLLLVAGAAVALLAGGIAVAATHGSSSEANRLRAIEHMRLRALVDADTATAGELIASDFQLINPAGGVSSRDNYLEAIETMNIDYRAFEPVSPIQVWLSGDAAALLYQASLDLVIGGDTHVSHQAWVTGFYERRDGRWQIVWEQATAIPNSFDLFMHSIEPIT
jgi:hypothetical protein